MPLYEYYCDKCDSVFEVLRSLRESEEPSPCPKCGSESQRILSTAFAAMSWRDGYAQRVPYHQRPVRNVERKRSVAPLKARRRAESAKKRKGRKA